MDGTGVSHPAHTYTLTQKSIHPSMPVGNAGKAQVMIWRHEARMIQFTPVVHISATMNDYFHYRLVLRLARIHKKNQVRS